MSSRKEALALDFDGVICDSILECFVTGYNAYRQLFTPKARRFFDVSRFDGEVFEQFKKLRPLVKTGEDYVLVFCIINKNLHIESPVEFELFRKKVFNYPLFAQTFYAERMYLQQKRPDLWNRYNILYEGMKKKINALDRDFRLYVVTTKDSTSVKKIFDSNNLSFKDSNIIGKEISSDKLQMVEFIRKRDGIPLKSIYFIDDQVEHLKILMKYGINCFLATWGYNNSGQLEEAQRYSIPLLYLESFDDCLREYLRKQRCQIRIKKR